MAEINITRDSKLIKVLAAQATTGKVDADNIAQANQIITELAQDLNPQNRHMIAQTVAFTIDEIQQHELDFMQRFADIKNINLGERATFRTKTGGIKAFWQAYSGTTPRTFVGDKQVSLHTEDISARPAIHLYDLKTGRVNFADLIKEANAEMTKVKIRMVEQVLRAQITALGAPWYTVSTGSISKVALDQVLTYFKRFGPVTILGDIWAISQVAALTGMAMSATQTQFSPNLIDENNNSGFIGRYNGCDVVAMINCYEKDKKTPMLNEKFLYIIPGGVTPDMRNLKVIQEGPVTAFDSQSIDDMTYEMRLDQRFGVGWVETRQPNIGGHLLNF